MFDGELSSAECELLARRLTRDEALRATMVALRADRCGAARRARREAARPGGTPRPVCDFPRNPLMAMPAAADVAAEFDSFQFRPPTLPWVTAGCALRARCRRQYRRGCRGDVHPVAANPGTGTGTRGERARQRIHRPAARTGRTRRLRWRSTQPEPAPVSNGEPERYSTPAPSSQTSIAPPARFANYVVAHSEYSGPLGRRMALLGIVGTEAAGGDASGRGRAAGCCQPRTNSSRSR